MIAETPYKTSSTSLHGQPLALARIGFLFLALGALALFAAGLPLFYEATLNVEPLEQAALAGLGLTSQFFAAYHTGLVVFLAATFAVCGFLVFWRRSYDWLAILVALTLVGQGTNAFAPLKLLALEPGWTIPARLTIGSVIFLLPLACYLFPDGRLVPRWGRFVLLIWGAWLLVSALWQGFPLNIFEFYEAQSTRVVYFVSLLLVLLTGIYAQIYRYRNIASAVQRQQTKWIIFGIVAGIVAGVGVNLLTLAFAQTHPTPSADIVFSLIAQTLSVLAQLTVPVTVVLSILRYRLWDIDLVINRSLVYVTLSAILAVIYFGAILLIHQLFRDMSGGQQSSLALAISALAVAVLYNPARSRIQAVFDRRFFPRGQGHVERVYTSPGSSHVAGLSIGTHLGQYEVRQMLGRGGMAECIWATIRT
jgi:hypothetical protein